MQRTSLRTNGPHGTPLAVAGVADAFDAAGDGVGTRLGDVAAIGVWNTLTSPPGRGPKMTTSASSAASAAPPAASGHHRLRTRLAAGPPCGTVSSSSGL